MPVFEGLIPKEILKRTMDLLFVLAQWHALGKLCLHTNKTLEIVGAITWECCSELQAFEQYTSKHKELETRKEK